jgi:hypothetical protein
LAVVLATAVIAALITSSAQATVSRSQRNVVVFVSDLSTGFSGLEQNFYQAVEKAAYLGAVTILSPVYQNVFQVEGSNATLLTLRNALSAATTGSSITAVDLIFVTHGLNRNVVFAGNNIVPVTTVRDDLLSHLSIAQRAKLRIVFSTACFGASQRFGWTESGFKAASGSKGVYADSASSYVPFLTAWALGQSFGSAITIANLADPFHVWDSIANNTVLAGTSFAGTANSTRVISGNSGLTIDGNPVGTFNLAPATATSHAGRTVTYTFSWTVPRPHGWQGLRNVDLRVRDAKGTAIALGWNQATNTLTLVNASRRPTSGPKQPGQSGSLRGSAALLSLRAVRVAASGRTVRLKLPLTLLRHAAGRTLRVEVSATDDSGRKTPWNVAGVLTVAR